MRQFIFIVLFSIQVSTQAYAQIQLIGTDSRGTGCPVGSARVVLTPENSVFSILYDQMDTKAAGSRKEQRKQCDTTITLQIPAGQQLEFNFVRYNGFMGLENSSSWGYVNSRAYFLDGTVQFPGMTPQKSTDLSAPILRFFQPGPREENFTWTGEYKGTYPRIVSPCNGRAVVRVRAEVITSIGPEGGSGMTTLDTADGVFSQTYKMTLRACGK